MELLLKRLITLIVLTVGSFNSLAFTPTNQQIELFKKLSPEQQKALAQKYNIDISNLGLMQGLGLGLEQEEQVGELVLPRDGSMLGVADEESLEQKESEDDGELKHFGYDLFAGQPTTFSPLTHAPVPESYILGIGDQIQVNLFGKENQQYELRVDNEGKLNIPGISPLQVAGMAYSEAKDFLIDNIEKQFIGINASISFGELRSIRVLVVGDVYTPGSYILSSLSTITHALYSAGGIRDVGSLREVQLKRNGKNITTLDLYDLLLSGDNSDDRILQSGDVIFVPSAKQLVSVDGEVKRPAIYEVKGESYQELINYAGGFTQAAFRENAYMYSFQQGLKVVNNINLSSREKLNSRVPVSADYLRVPASSPKVDNAVQIIGAVTHAGFYQWKNGLSLADVFKSKKSSFAENADLSYGLILRYSENGIIFRQFKPIDVIDRSANSNMELQPEDKVFVFSHDNGFKQLLEFNDYATEDDLMEKIKENTEKSIDDYFFWDMYRNTVNASLSKKSLEASLPTLHELENIDFSELVSKYSIVHWHATSRQYLLWEIYRTLLQSNYNNNTLNLVEVRGNVKYPGVYPFPENGTLKQLVDAAGGAKELSATNIKVSRLNGKEVKQFDVNSNRALEFPVVKRDTVTVFEKPDSASYVTVELKGEVKYPGKYSVRRGDKLSTLIEKAGGFTEYAYLEGAVFVREELKQKERENLKILSQDLRKQLASKKLSSSVTANNASYSELQKVLDDLTSVEAVGRMVIDLPQIINHGMNDIAMVRGDMLYIPSRSETVSVVGEVFQPTSHRFMEGISVEQYVSMSGGVKSIGDEDNVYVVKANGAVVIPENGFWFANAQSELQAGDTIVVPMNAAPVDNLTLWSQVTQILYQMSLAVVAIGRL